MKILELRLKNLNSLYCEWRIDFTDPEYISNGIFALTGPTGSGKSTILDAICLALYGATPRLGRISKSSNEIMSRQTGECYAEVVFESQLGRYRSKWTQRRARKSPEGKLQDQEHEISDADTGKLIETKKSLVLGVIEEKTGMDFERFTRSILLAQGGFDTFLKASIEEKSRILEQITGTGIYSDISRRVHERQRDEKNQLDILMAETSGINILEPDQEQQYQEDLNVNQLLETDLSTKTIETNKAITWLTTVNELKKEIHTLFEESETLDKKTEAFKPQRAKLDTAKKAAFLDGLCAKLTALRNQQTEDQSHLNAEETNVPSLEASVSALFKEHASAEQAVVKAKEASNSAHPLIQKIRLLDQQLADQTKAIYTESDSCQSAQVKIDTDSKKLNRNQQKYSTIQRALKEIDQYLNDNAQDECLISGLAGIEEQFRILINTKADITQINTQIKKADTGFQKATKVLESTKSQRITCNQKLKEAQQSVQIGKDALADLLGDKMLREYRAEKDALQKEKEYLARIAALEQHRTQLEDGKACPLCGALDHPFSTGNIPAPDEIDKKINTLTILIRQAEDQDIAIRKLHEVEVTAQTHLSDSEKLEAIAKTNKNQAEKYLAERKQSLTQRESNFDTLKHTVLAKLHPHGIREIPDTAIEALLESLRFRLIAWQKEVAKKHQSNEKLIAIDSESKQQEAVITSQQNALLEKQAHLEKLQQDLKANQQERHALYGDKQPEDEETRFNKAISTAEMAEKTIRITHSDNKQKLALAHSQIDTLKKRIAQRTPELTKVEVDFSTSLHAKGFETEQNFLQARLSQQEQESLSIEIKKFDDAQTNLKLKLNDRETRLKTETAKNISDKSLDVLQAECKANEQSLKELREIVAALKHKLNENTVAKERVQAKQSLIEAQKTECLRWDKLHNLIGSSDGKKYRNFAQGLTFELMVSHANRQLSKMTDRYLLIRDEQEPLALNIIDDYQAGEIRSVKNLSGGECFIISLSLALGLSKMSSKKVRIDSLFLDEGFGTLDEDALDMALDALSSLHEENKLIGVISHISALKNRISTQISVSPQNSGRSGIVGPGCAREILHTSS